MFNRLSMQQLNLTKFKRAFSSPSTSSNNISFKSFWNWTTQKRPHWKESYKEAAVIFCVFGVTGSSSVILVRPFLKNTIGLEGSLKDGPNSYRVLSILLVSPIYAAILLTLGTITGRHNFFANMATKIFGRFLPKKYGTKLVCDPAAKKRKI